MKKKILMLIVAAMLVLGTTACGTGGDTAGSSGGINTNFNGGGSNNAQKNVCGICGGTGWQNQIMYYDMNNFPVYGQVVCGGCSGFGYN